MPNTSEAHRIITGVCTTFHCAPLNGSHAGDQNGQFTFVSNQGNSVIDYCIVSVDFISKLNINFEVGARVESSHMPLQFNINSQPGMKVNPLEKCEEKRKCNNSELEPRTDGRFS